MLIRFCLVLVFFPVAAFGGWTGIAGFIGSSDSDWSLVNQIRQADMMYYGFSIEEKTSTELRVGASGGQYDLKLTQLDNIFNTEKFTGEFLTLYLRLPVVLAKSIKLHSDLHYAYHRGSSGFPTLEQNINWGEWLLNIGISVQLGRVSVRPFVNFRSINGDISNDSGTRIFELESSKSSGIILDYYVENTAYVRFRATGAENESLQISLVREF